MSKLGKIFLYIAVAGAIVSVIAGVGVLQKRAEDKANLDQATAAKAAADQATAKQKAIAEAATQAKTDADKQLADTKAQVDTLNTQLTDAKKQADDAKGAVDAAKAAADKAAADLAAITSKLNGQSPDDLIAAKTKAEKDLQASQDEQKILQDNLQADQKKVADLMDAINRKATGSLPPGISGKVTWVNRTWNFVVLDVGLSNGVVPNGELIVYRKNNFLGKVKVTSVDANTCVADILPDVKGDIQVGDYVLN